MSLLQNVTVLDLTRFLSGPYATMILGDMGADVIKVERPPGGDETRKQGPYVNGESYCFAMVNRNKRSIAIDLASRAGRDVVLRLASEADIVVENFRPGVTQRLGLDYATIRERNPAVVYTSITGFGQDGPYRLRPGFDIIAQGIDGFLRMTGQPDGRPAKFGVAIDDLVAGLTAVHSTLAAYIHRVQTGEGQHIDVSLVDAGLALTVWEAAAYFGTGEQPDPTGTRHRRNAPYQAYRTSDGYVTIGGNTEPMWRALCRDVLQAPDLLADERYADRDARLDNVEALERDIERVTTTRSTQEWVAALEAAGVPGGPVYTYGEALEDEHVVARGMVREVEHPRMGTIRTLGPPAKLSETPMDLRLPAPAVGEHTGDILAARGFDRAEVDALFRDGVLFDETAKEATGG